MYPPPSGSRALNSAGGSECVEVVFLDSGVVGVRDSKNPAGPALIFAPAEWDALPAGCSGQVRSLMIAVSAGGAG
ncbi:DUF397 domain-containing protein [Nocardia sp. NPDC051787]|uniref:DUF397 domain-containing protein n=1 Tax=Nocardia sp. NPDC051787 TaxID=3155415 RepID=UPI00342ADB94